MENQNEYNVEEKFSRVLRAGRRTYFFDVRETKAGDYYLTITESKKFTNEDGTFYYKKHKIYLYKEDFDDFNSSLNETFDFIIEKKGKEVLAISMIKILNLKIKMKLLKKMKLLQMKLLQIKTQKNLMMKILQKILLMLILKTMIQNKKKSYEISINPLLIFFFLYKCTSLIRLLS